MKRTAIILLLSSASPWTFPAGAQSAPGGGEAVPIDSIAVTARHSRPAAPVQLIGGERLRKLPANSVADAVRYFSGVQIKDYGGIGGLKTIDVRTLGSAHAGVFYDGIAVGNAQNAVVDLGRFSLEGVEAVTLYNGQKSDIFQSARDFASAAAIYIASRQPLFEQGRRDNFNVKLKGGSFDLFDASALWEHRFVRKDGRERVSSAVNVAFMNTSGRYRFRALKNNGSDTTMTRRGGDVMTARGEAALFGTLPRGEWRVRGYFYGSERGYPGSVITQDYTLSLLSEERQRDLDLFVQGSLRRQPSPVYSYRIQGKYAYNYANYMMSDGTVKGTPADIHYRQSEAYLSVANLFDITRWLSANLSVDGQYNSLEARDTKQGRFNANFQRPRRLTVLSVAAVSAETKKFSAKASLLYTHTHEARAAGSSTAADRNIFTPSLALSWRPFDRAGVELRAFYKHIFRLPTFNDLYYTEIGDSALRPEYATQYNAGAVWRREFPSGFLAAMNASVDLYYNEVRDKIVAVPMRSPLVWSMQNLGYVEIRGIDATLGSEMRAGAVRLNLRVAYTFQLAQDFSENKKPTPIDDPLTVDKGYGFQIPYTPRHSGSAIVGVEYRDWDLNYGFLGVGERYRNNQISSRMPPWNTHDLAVSYNLRLPHASLRTTAQVGNILDRQYEVVSGYPMPGVNFKIILSLTI